MKKYALHILLVLLCLSARAQTAEEEFVAGKKAYNDKLYKLASLSFKNVINYHEKSQYAPFATYYYALSAYAQKQSGHARDMLVQLLNRYPDFDQVDEVYFKLAYHEFQVGNFDKGLSYAAYLRHTALSEDAERLIRTFLWKLDNVETLANLYYQFDDDIVAERIIELAMNTSLIKDFDLIKAIYDGHKEKVLSAFGSVERNTEKVYRVALLLPFMVDGYENLISATKNKLVLDLYRGIHFAVNALAKDSIRVELYPYDTKRTGESTRKILEKAELKHMDLIIGPLFQEPHDIVEAFSKEHKINMFNPLSTLPSEGNNFSFIYKPSRNTIAEASVDFVKQRMRESTNKYCAIFYEDNSKDSTVAAAYNEAIKEAGFLPVIYKEVEKGKARVVGDVLAEKEKVYYRHWELDSLRKLPEPPIYKRVLNIDDTAKYFVEYLSIAKDSIGHTFIASSSGALGSTAVSALEQRDDNMMLVGHESWLTNKLVNFTQLSRHDVSLVSPLYYNRENQVYRNFKEEYTLRYGEFPSLNAMVGFELLNVTGRLFSKFGRYIQLGFFENEIIPGVLFEGMQYGVYQDNKVVPIVKLDNDELVRVK